MRNWWLTYTTPNGAVVFIQEAWELGAARIKAALAGAPPHEQFKEGFPLELKMKVPKKYLGRVLSAKEAEALLKTFK